VRLRAQVVDLIGLDLVDPLAQRRGVGQVAVVQLEARGGNVGVLVDVVQALRVEVGGCGG